MSITLRSDVALCIMEMETWRAQGAASTQTKVCVCDVTRSKCDGHQSSVTCLVQDRCSLLITQTVDTDGASPGAQW